MQKFIKPAVPQKPKIYLKFSDLGQLPENEASIALDLLAQCGAEHFLRSETELLKRLASNLSMIGYLKKMIAMEQVDPAALIAKLISVESTVCRYLREARMTVATREKAEELPEEAKPFTGNNDDLFEGMEDD
jgi:hypothetical protein